MFANIGWPQLLIVLVIVLAIFGTKRFRNVGSDLGRMFKGFKEAVNEGEKVKDQISDATKPDADFDSTPAEETRKDSA